MKNSLKSRSCEYSASVECQAIRIECNRDSWLKCRQLRRKLIPFHTRINVDSFCDSRRLTERNLRFFFFISISRSNMQKQKVSCISCHMLRMRTKSWDCWTNGTLLWERRNYFNQVLFARNSRQEMFVLFNYYDRVSAYKPEIIIWLLLLYQHHRFVLFVMLQLTLI